MSDHNDFFLSVTRTSTDGIPLIFNFIVTKFPSRENVFRLHVHFHADQNHFHMKGFGPRLV